MTKNAFNNYWQRFETFCTLSRFINLVTMSGNNFHEQNDLQSLLSCYCCPADQSKLMTDVCWNKCDSLWSWCGISSAASISFYAFHTFLLAWMDHNGRMWFERSLGGPETHIPNSTISYPALENHIPYPYHIIPTAAFHTHTLFLTGPAFQEDYTFISRQTPGLRLLEDLMFTKRLPMVLISVSAGRRTLFTY